MQPIEPEAINTHQFLYKTKTSPIPIVLITALITPSLIFSWESPGFRSMFIALILFNLLTLFIHFTFSINEGKLTFNTFFMKWLIYSRDISPSDIKEVKFKRANWAAKLVLIKTTNGLPVRLFNFHPEYLFWQLEQYCKIHKVPYKKSKDYKILDGSYKKDAD
ncbi:hypothetical protein KP77_15290 [Jeotgalibacillus alimentarius]|uniref:Uncharacterized protein n=1 Tax=Jeotgalibacillus alimentarius TaxID=135826 RepID=A0A0C2S822_9BACL|nr:hypothetical protein [Jeotgalibacillus alimentarius]KIL50154.1 hypothetical protein KP77_15290 [Jeotgalibacillus alimentarius]